MSTKTDTSPPHVRPTFASILCGVDGSRPSFEAARQAALLAGDGAALTYVAVTSENGVRANAVATLHHERAQECLKRVSDDARDLGVSAQVVEEEAEDAAGRLMELAAGHDLLVVGILGHSRAGGIMLGSVATAALHRSPVPVLVARRPPDGVEFPSRILLASDGTPMSDSAAELTIRLAARHGAHAAIVGARDREAPFRRGLAEHAAQIMAATGSEPLILDEFGPPHRAAASAAEETRASLVVTGSRGLTGASAIRSASERIAHAAPCSVLVARPLMSHTTE
jgi:nucleotide-binding universal stress UspA family protein